MPDPGDGIRSSLSRRRLLGGIATVGAAGALGGAGTMAFFSDEESFANNELMAGSLDMKAAYSSHYSDWSPDEGNGVDVVMYEGAPGTVGESDEVPAGHTGLPANDAWLIAVDDPEQFLTNTEQRAVGSASCPEGTDADALEQPVIDLEDVKPGDFGEVTFDFALCDNPGYVWLQVAGASASENGRSEPEADDDDEGAGVELLDVVQAAYWIDDGDNYQDGEETPVTGSLREIINQLAAGGVALQGDVDAAQGGGTGEQGCFSADNTPHSIAFAWWVPIDHGNEIQTDSASFSLNLYTEQCRHNDGQPDPLTTFLNDEMAFKASPNWDGSVDDSGLDQDEVIVDVGAMTPVEFGPFPELPVAYDPLVVKVSTGTTVTWEWLSSQPPIPHDVVSVVENGGAPLFANPGGVLYAPGNTYSHTFSNPGVYPYYCTPHGAPFMVGSSPGAPVDEVLNEFGMRGAVVVE